MVSLRVQPAGAYAGGAIAGAPDGVAETDTADPACETAVDGPETEGIVITQLIGGFVFVLAVIAFACADFASWLPEESEPPVTFDSRRR